MSDRRQTVEILKKIYENAETGMNTTKKVISGIKSGEMREFLELQKNKYYDIAAEAAAFLAGCRELPPQTGFFSNLAAGAAIMMNIAGGIRDEKTAEFLINGCTGGIIDLMRALAEHAEADAAVKNLAQRLIAAEQDCIKNAERFL